MLGISIWPLNRLRTLLSIPLGLRQFFYSSEKKYAIISHKFNTRKRWLCTVQTVWCCQEAYRNLHISVGLVANELLSSLFDNFGFCEGPEGCHVD